MKKDEVPGDTLKALNALLDGQLAPGERARVERQINADSAVRARLDELERVQALVRKGFDDTRRRARRPRGGWRYSAAAAAAMLVVGLALGWGLRANLSPAPGAVPVDDAYVMLPVHLAPPTAGAGKVLLHLGSSDADRARTALARVEALLAQYADERKRVSFEVVVNSTGLDLLRAGTSPVGERIRALQQRYGNLTFVVCRQTFERWRTEHGAEPALLPGVVVGAPALEHIITRLEEGWTYLRV